MQSSDAIFLIPITRVFMIVEEESEMVSEWKKNDNNENFFALQKTTRYTLTIHIRELN